MSSAALQPTTDPAESLARSLKGCVRRSRRGRERSARFTDQASGLGATAPFGRLVRGADGGFPSRPAGDRPDFAPPRSRRSGLVPHARRAAALLRRGLGCLLRLMPGRAAFGRAVQNWLFGPEIGGAACSVAASSPQPQPAAPDIGDPAGAGALCAATRSSTLPAAKPNPGPPLLWPPARSPLPIPATPPFSLPSAPSLLAGGRRWRRLSRGRPGSGRFLPRRPSRLRTRRPAFFAMA